jgi:hypothetical protein
MGAYERNLHLILPVRQAAGAVAEAVKLKQQSRQLMDQDRRLCLIASNNAAPVHKRYRQGLSNRQ